MTMIASGSQPQQQQQTPSDHLFRGFQSISSSLTSRLGNLKENSLISESFGNLLSSVKNLIPSQKSTVITSIVQQLMANTSQSQINQEYSYFDPRTTRGVGGKRAQGAFGDAIVFLVGGGGVMEYGYLQEWAKAQGKRIVYGSDELLSPSEFVGELDKLGV
jgi:sec1 family domain-containing protein 1